MTERYMLCRAYGAEVHLSDPADGAEGFVELAKQLAVKTPESFVLSQFNNPSNPAAHHGGTGPEIWAETQGNIDVLVPCFCVAYILSGLHSLRTTCLCLCLCL
jgi:cysteine synthase A